MPNQDDNTSKRNDAVSADQSGEALTVTERDILRLVAYGLTNKEIASQLCLAEKTVKNHLIVIFEKVGVRNRTEAALWARDNGLTSEANE